MTAKAVQRSSIEETLKLKEIINNILQYSAQSHNDLWLSDGSSNAFVGQHLAPIDVQLVLDNHVFSQHCVVFHSHPPPNNRSPPNYTSVEPGV